MGQHCAASNWGSQYVVSGIFGVSIMWYNWKDTSHRQRWGTRPSKACTLKLVSLMDGFISLIVCCEITSLELSQLSPWSCQPIFPRRVYLNPAATLWGLLRFTEAKWHWGEGDRSAKLIVWSFFVLLFLCILYLPCPEELTFIFLYLHYSTFVFSLSLFISCPFDFFSFNRCESVDL